MAMLATDGKSVIGTPFDGKTRSETSTSSLVKPSLLVKRSLQLCGGQGSQDT